MNRVILFLALVVTKGPDTSPQIWTTPKDNASPAEYATYMADKYSTILDLTPQQRQQTYQVILDKRRTLDSIKSNKISISSDKLWGINISLDTKFKEILTASQYMAYEDLSSHGMVGTIYVRPDSGRSR